jgi:hypothetical protein
MSSVDRETYMRLVELAQERREEARRCHEADAHLAACILEGAALEAALLVTALNHEAALRAEDRWPKRRFDRWDLGLVLELALSEGWIDDDSRGDFAQALVETKKVRNLVHPAAFVRDVPVGETIDADQARAIFDTLEHVWDATWATINLFYPEDAEEGWKKLARKLAQRPNGV